jgi:hypothetical protein
VKIRSLIVVVGAGLVLASCSKKGDATAGDGGAATLDPVKAALAGDPVKAVLKKYLEAASCDERLATLTNPDANRKAVLEHYKGKCNATYERFCFSGRTPSRMRSTASTIHDASAHVRARASLSPVARPQA